MNQPSSTITAATLSGMGMTVIWDLIIQFGLVTNIRPALIAGTVTLVVALVGYFKKENVLPLVKK